MVVLSFKDGYYELKPTKIICLGRNYAKRAKEMKSEVPKEPIIFLKPPSSLLPPDSTIILPERSKNVHHEVELGVVIGKGGSNLEIIKKAYHLYNKIKNEIRLSHIKAHAGFEGNELADRMTVFAIEKKSKEFVRYAQKIDIAKILKMRTG